ncbi:MAG: hypothetical protein HQ494_04905 [Rhodospirillales bacterium]|nr:hypothetical protein [Rhodospirillales bacterium]
MATTHDHSHHGPEPSGSGEQDHTLLVQGAILIGIVILLVLASFFDVI